MTGDEPRDANRPELGSKNPGALFAQSAAIMARLRAPGGCPWDREQTHASIRRYTLEETYEVLDAIERKDWPNLCEELGDLLLQVLFYAQMSDEAGDFTLADVLAHLNRKLVRRHPHVFGEQAAAAAGNRATALAELEGDAPTSTAAVLSNWTAIKQQEKRARAGSEGEKQPEAGRLAGVLRAQPALLEAAKLGAAAARCGFDWQDARGLLDKVREESAELEAELASAADISAAENTHGIAEEYGDLLFTVANLGRHLKLDPETALRDANGKFRRRFETVEQGSDRPLEELTSDELEQGWAMAKRREGR